jgi:predicted Fe-S protein YdhL (DUF1289 family)
MKVCNGVCHYIAYKDTQACVGCGRTYDDLERWAYLTDFQKKAKIKESKLRLKLLKNQQKFE